MFRVDAGALRLTTDRAAVFLGRRSKGLPSDDSSKGGTSRVIDAAIPGSVCRRTMNRMKVSKNDARQRSSELDERLHKLGRLCELVRSEANQAIEESRRLRAECERLDQLLIEFRKAS